MATEDPVELLRNLARTDREKAWSRFHEIIRPLQCHGISMTRKEFEHEWWQLEESGKTELDGTLGVAIGPPQGLLRRLLDALKRSALRICQALGESFSRENYDEIMRAVESDSEQDLKDTHKEAFHALHLTVPSEMMQEMIDKHLNFRPLRESCLNELRGELDLLLMKVMDADPKEEESLAHEQHHNRFYKDGSFWEVSYEQDVVGEMRVKDSRGMSFIHYLLRTPGREIYASELLNIVCPPDLQASANMPRHEAQQKTGSKPKPAFGSEELTAAIRKQNERDRKRISAAIGRSLDQIEAAGLPLLAEDLRKHIRLGSSFQYNPPRSFRWKTAV